MSATVISGVTSLWGRVAIVVVWLLLVGFGAECVNRFTNAGNEAVRKVIHIGSGNVVLLAWWLKIPMWVGVGASIFFSAVALLSYFVPILPNINSIGRKSYGTLFYAISIGVLVAWFWSIDQPQFAAIGILVMTWGDGLAALIGQRFGRHAYKLWDSKKSWEGSLTMGAVSFLVCAAILIGTIGQAWQVWIISLIVAIVATGLEAFSKYGIDNLTVPICSGAIAFFLNQWLFNL